MKTFTNTSHNKYTLDSLDKVYIKETLLLLHAATNRKEGHSTNTYKRFKKSINILTRIN